MRKNYGFLDGAIAMGVVAVILTHWTTIAKYITVLMAAVVAQ